MYCLRCEKYLLNMKTPCTIGFVIYLRNGLSVNPVTTKYQKNKKTTQTNKTTNKIVDKTRTQRFIIFWNNILIAKKKLAIIPAPIKP